MTLEMLVSAALMDYNPTEQAYILKAIEEDTLPKSQRLHTGVMKVMEAFDAYEPTIEGYAGFKVDRSARTRRARSGLSVISPSTPIPIIRDIVTASFIVHT